MSPRKRLLRFLGNKMMLRISFCYTISHKPKVFYIYLCGGEWVREPSLLSPPRSYFADPAVFVPVFEVGVFGVLFAEACLQHPYDIKFCFRF